MRIHAEIESVLPPRLQRELKTIEAMIDIYCRAHHGTDKSLCPECSRLLHYAARRLHRCPFQEDKPTCGNCRVHCYKADMREAIREVMQYAGPRMTFRHPRMAFRHLLDSRRTPPDIRTKGAHIKRERKKNEQQK